MLKYIKGNKKLGNTNENKENTNENSNGDTATLTVGTVIFTILQNLYMFKMITFAVVAVFTVWKSGDWDSLLIGAFTYSIGILFDFSVVLIQNAGPKERKITIISRLFVGLIFASLALIVCYFMGGEQMSETLYKKMKLLVFILMLLFGIAGPAMEIYANRPKND